MSKNQQEVLFSMSVPVSEALNSTSVCKEQNGEIASVWHHYIKNQ